MLFNHFRSQRKLWMYRTNYPKKPIEAGEEASIDVTFDSKGRTGKQTKAVTIIANTNPNRKVIRINSEVISE